MRKQSLKPLVSLFCLVGTLLSAGTLAQAQPTATWNGAGGDGLWNTALNWDIGVPAEGTNAVIAAGNTVTYSSPMAATSFGSLSGGAVLNINAAGFVSAATGDGAIGLTGTAAKLFINSGGVVTTLAGGLTLSNAAGLSISSGGSLNVAGNFLLGRNSTGNTGFATNNGGTISASATSVNPNNNSSTSLLLITGGSNYLGNVVVKRSSQSGSFSAIGTEGLVISNAVVNMTSLDVGGTDGNSYLTMQVASGAVTNTGSFIERQVTAARSSRFLQHGGIFQSVGGGAVNLRGHASANVIVIYSVTGGTNIIDGIALGTPGATDTTGTIRLTNAARIYLGAAGITSTGTLNTRTLALNTGGSFGAQADWAGTEPILLSGGAFDAADLDGVPHNISLTGIVSGPSPLTKNGGGILTLNAAETYTGNTVVNQGTLALGASGSIAGSPSISVGAGATFDFSAVTGFTLGATRTLGGSGTVTGDVAVASSGIINPGSSAGTLTLASSLTVTGAAVLHFDLPTVPGPGNDLLIISNNINASGNNTLEIVGGGSPGTVHTLIQYGGTFNGTLGNFTISGTTGVLSNNASVKTISLIVQSSVRTPTNVVWIGGTINDWDTVNRTNWQNSGTGLLDYFVSGDNALFNNAGLAHPVVNLVGNDAPASLTVGASGNYIFGGSGSISGSGSLLKTNSGTLTITNLNTFSGGVTIGGGVLEASVLDIAGSPSSIGAGGADPTKFVIDGGAFRYLGPTVSIDRPATLGTNGATIDIPSNSTTLTISGPIAGAALTKVGPGQLALGVANSYTNGTVINAGTFQVNNNAAAGTGPVTNNAAAMLIQGALVLDNLVDFEGNCALEFNGVGGNNTALRGAWTGSGTVNVYFLTANSGQTFTMGGSGAGGGHQWNFSGTVDFGTNTGFLRINNDNSTFNFGSSNATFNVGTADAALNQRNGGTTTHLGALFGGPNTKLSGRGGTGSSGTTTYAVGGKNIDCTFAGQINNGSGTTAITKVGTGKLTLSGASTHTGVTAVESGVLEVDGSFSSSAVTVDGGTLSGNGNLGGGVNVNFGATLSPGVSGIGQMTIPNNLTLQSGSTNFMEIDKAHGTNDSIVGLGSVSYSGTLIVTNLSGSLALGDTFKLFDSSSYGGAFESFVLPSLSGSLLWNTNTLLVDGTLRVASPQPSIGSVSVSGGTVSFSGTSLYPNRAYNVLASTNVALPLTSWTLVTTGQFDQNGVFNFSESVDPAVSQKFYNIQVPPQ
ncbi:MAG TPA: autotransporter-associated beta strand repeat-containing protein [Candidatus Dormibacteraeota bacterium]|nr:autotransporter-associated beta strand repeat-containing protein [Candidatus Dormibacteraeota bacterium]